MLWSWLDRSPRRSQVDHSFRGTGGESHECSQHLDYWSLVTSESVPGLVQIRVTLEHRRESSTGSPTVLGANRRPVRLCVLATEYDMAVTECILLLQLHLPIRLHLL